jgi:hypothetical protein
MPITVGPEPPPGMEGDSYYTELTAAGGAPPYTWKCDTPLSDGLVLMPLAGSEQAAIQGVPTEAGSTPCTITVTDSAGDSVSQKFPLNIRPRLAISTRGLPQGIEGKPYEAKLNAQGGGTSHTWTASGVPDGLRVDAGTGKITGIPAAAGTPFTIRVADDAGHTAEGNFTITLRSRHWWDRFFHTTIWLVFLGLGLPVLGGIWIIVYSFATPGHHWSYLGTGMLTALAAFLAGCVIGFLFGIPRAVSSGQLRHEQGSVAYTPSSNLAEVSDWLTKLLLGAGLVQLTRLGAPIGHLIDSVAAGLTAGAGTPVPSSAAKVIAGTILFGYAAIGLLDAYVVTTMWYQQKLEKQAGT